MIRVKKLSHAAYETPDLQAQTEYYTDVLGLAHVGAEKGITYLGGTVDHHSIALTEGPNARCSTIAFQIAPDEDLADFAKQTEKLGLKVETVSDPEPNIAKMVRFEDTKGTQMHVFQQPDPVTRDFTGKGIQTSKLGHVAFHVTDVKKATEFYCDVLGFRVSDWMGDFFSFLRCGTDHHTINLVETGKDAHFHTAFELRDWNHIQTAADILAQNDYRLMWGPGRHGIGHNLFTYHKGPNGLITELFAELDQMTDESLGYFEPRPWHEDSPQRPKVWERGPNASNVWGPQPPEEMMKI